MRIFFIQGGSRLKVCENGKFYTDGNFTDEVWKRYLQLGDNLVILLRKEKKIYDEETANKKFNPVLNDSRVEVVPLEDITRPKSNIINPIIRKKIRKKIFEEVQKADKIIIRSCSYYTLVTYEACKKYNKQYLVEVAGFAKEGYVYHSFIGKIIANNYENRFKKLVYNAQYALYVTEDALQKRYPCKGKMLGCSDVQINPLDKTIIEKRKEMIRNRTGKLIIGTAAFLDVKWKGQENVIKAISELKRQGVDNISYELIGLGHGKRLKDLASKLGVLEQVKFMGATTHEGVFEWLDHIDVYVQPSYQEGLCRAIVEAMSRGCPVISSNAGGNYELVEKEYIFNCGDYLHLANLIYKIVPHLEDVATSNFSFVKKYEKPILDSKREAFLKEFVEGTK